MIFSQLFYLITDLYKEGNAKEMKKWAYEIHSTFLVPGAVSITEYNLFIDIITELNYIVTIIFLASTFE